MATRHTYFVVLYDNMTDLAGPEYSVVCQSSREALLVVDALMFSIGMERDPRRFDDIKVENCSQVSVTHKSRWAIVIDKTPVPKVGN